MGEIVLAEKKTVFLPVWVGARPDSETPGMVLHAAHELARFLSEITGAVYPVVLSPPPPPPCITVISSPDESLGAEGFSIKTGPAGVRIEGGLPRGVLYGVYGFLERLGCRWWSSAASHIPRREKLSVPSLDIREIPALEYRDIISADANDGAYSARNRYNGQFAKLDESRGGRIRYYPFVHTFDSLIPPEKYFDAHPEYFSLVDGKRLKERTQLCLTNPDVKRLAVETVEKWITEHPEASIFSISQNDWYNPCDCEECAKLNEAEGARSGSLIHFINHIAEAVEKKHPHVVLDTLAYQWSRPAPKKVRPRHNVCVRLCSIECCFNHPLRSCSKVCSMGNLEHGESFQKDLQDWAKVCSRLYIWDYVVNFHHYVMPFPNFRVLADNIRFFIENNVKGVFEEAATSVYGGTEFAELRAWVLGKLLWNPYQDADKLAEEFITGYYRAAADPVREYFRLIHDEAARNPDTHFGIYDQPRTPYLTGGVIKKGFELFDRAFVLADDDEIYRRVRVASMPLRYWEVYTMPLDQSERPARVEQFFADLAELGINEIKEGASIKESVERMKLGIQWRFPPPV
jgi:hypothetical protein